MSQVLISSHFHTVPGCRWSPPFLWFLNLHFQDKFPYSQLFLRVINLNIPRPFCYTLPFTSTPTQLFKPESLASPVIPLLIPSINSFWNHVDLSLHNVILHPYLFCPYCQSLSLDHHCLPWVWTITVFCLHYFNNLLAGFLAFDFSRAASKPLYLSNELILGHEFYNHPKNPWCLWSKASTLQS